MRRKKRARPLFQRELAIVVGQWLVRHGYEAGEIPSASSWQVFPGIYVNQRDVDREGIVMAIRQKPRRPPFAAYLHIPDDARLFDPRTPLLLEMSRPNDDVPARLLADDIGALANRKVEVYDPLTKQTDTVKPDPALDDQPHE